MRVVELVQPVTDAQIGDVALVMRDNLPAMVDLQEAISDFTAGPLSEINTRLVDLESADIITPQMFGAIGDGVADDTLAFQDAINFCADAVASDGSGGKELLVPAGTYLVSGLVVSRPITISGHGRRRTQIKLTMDSVGPAMKVEPTHTGFDYPSFGHPFGNITIRGIQFVGSDKNNVIVQDGLSLTRASVNSVYTEVVLHDVGAWSFSGCGFKAQSFNGLFRAYDINFYNNAQDGASINSCVDWRIIGGEIGVNGRDGILMAGCVQVRIAYVYCYANARYSVHSFNSAFEWYGGAIDLAGEHGLNYDSRRDEDMCKLFGVSFHQNSASSPNTYSDIRLSPDANNFLYLFGCDFETPNEGECLYNIFRDGGSAFLTNIGSHFKSGFDFANVVSDSDVMRTGTGNSWSEEAKQIVNSELEVVATTQYTGVRGTNGLTPTWALYGNNLTNSGGILDLYQPGTLDVGQRLAAPGTGVISQIQPPGPYVDDADAIANGVLSGKEYRQTGSGVAYVGGGSVGGSINPNTIYATRAAATAATVPTPQNFLRLYHQGTLLSYKREPSVITNPALTTNGGTVYWSPSDVVTARHWGATTEDRASAASNSVALTSSDAYAKSSQRVLILPNGILFISATVTMTTTWIGEGAGYWPVQPATQRPAAEQAIRPAPTQIVATGTFARTWTFPGVSSMDAAGATRVNPSARGAGYNDSSYKMLSFMNDDGTLKGFSIAVFATGHGLMSRGFRVLPDFGGADGQDGYEVNTEAGRSTADVDIGLYVEDVPQGHFQDIAVVGHWRMYGRLQSQILLDETSSVTGTSYHTAWTKCHFQGFVGAGQRGSDMYKIISVSTDKVYLPWSDDISLQSSRTWTTCRWNLSGNFQASILPAAIIAVAEVAGQCEVTFAADVSATLSAGNFLIPRGVGGGDSHTIETDCKYQGFTHTNGGMAHDGNKVTTPFAFPSKAYEKSGWRGTESVFVNAQFQHNEEVFFHLHDANLIVFQNVEFEKIVDTGSIPTNHARLISSANNTTHHPYNAGFVYRMTIHMPNKIDLRGLDLGPNIPVDRTYTFNGGGETGFLEASQLTIPSYNGSQHYYGPFVVPFTNGKAGIKKPGWPFTADAFAYNSATGNLEQSAPLVNLERPYILSSTVSGGGSVLYTSGDRVLLRIPDDSVATVTLSSVATNIIGAVASNSSTRGGGRFRGRASTTPFAVSDGGSIFAATNIALTGTTGTDGNITVSCFSGGVLYVENRTGAQADYLLKLDM